KSLSERMPMHDIPNNKTDNTFKYSVTEDTIQYDPNEAIEEFSPVVEQQQPVTNPASSDKATIRQTLKKCCF
ncbi:hypothetical protein AVEN_73604-1, partial [Araneus ventricosus]